MTLTEQQAVRRAVDRVGLGLPAAGRSAAQRRGWPAVRDLLAPTGPDRGGDRVPAPRFRPVGPGKPADEQAKRERRQLLRANATALQTWWLRRMVATDQPFVERMTWLWHGHFATSITKVRSAQVMLQQNDTLRRLGRSSFTELAQTMIVDPALLIWLDGQKNTKASANENLAREFMELFALGHGHYTELDVQRGARCLTGWVLRRSDDHDQTDADAATAVLRPTRHDDTVKTFLGSTGNFGAHDYVDIVLAQPASAPFVASRVWARLISHTAPDPTTLKVLTDAYGPERRIDQLVGAALDSSAFRDEASSLVKEPVLWLVGLLRALGVPATAITDKVADRLLTGLHGLGEVPFVPPNVGGWPSAAGWLSTASAASRMGLARAVVSLAPDAVQAVAGASDPIAAAAAALGVDGWSERTASSLGTLRRHPAQLVALAACSPECVVSR